MKKLKHKKSADIMKIVLAICVLICALFSACRGADDIDSDRKAEIFVLNGTEYTKENVQKPFVSCSVMDKTYYIAVIQVRNTSAGGCRYTLTATDTDNSAEVRLKIYVAVFQTAPQNAESALKTGEFKTVFPVAEGVSEYVLSSSERLRSGEADYIAVVVSSEGENPAFTSDDLARISFNAVSEKA